MIYIYTHIWDEFDDDSEVVSSFGAPESEVTKQNLEKQTTQYVWGLKVGCFATLGVETPSFGGCLGLSPSQ